MTFLEFLQSSNKTQATAARELGISQAHVSLLSRGKKRPSTLTMERIANWSGGQVQPQDWFSLPSSGQITDTSESQSPTGAIA